MKQYLSIVLVGAMVAFGAGCSDNGGGGQTGGTGGGTGGTGGGVGGNGGNGGGPASACEASEGVDLCADNGGSGDVSLPTNITEDTCLSADCDYLVTTLHFVEDGTLTIKPGVQVLGEGSEAGNAALIITNTGKIEAVGTPDAPIVMTSALPVKTAGDWGGLVMLGKARINSGTSISGADNCDGAQGDCQDFIEGLDPEDPDVGDRAFYGGNDDTHDCGTLTYVRVEFGGFQFTQDNETNSVTLGGCGSDTDLDYVQAHRGRDDAFEMFGGKPNLRHIIASGMDDDGIDWDQGFTGVIEYAVVDHYAGGSDDPRGFETDNIGSGTFDAEPRSAPTVRWVTAIGYTGQTPQGTTRDTQQGVLNREGTRGQMSDMIVTNFNTLGYDMRDNGWDGAWPDTFFVERTCFWNNTTDFPDDTNDESTDTPGTFFDEPTQLLLAELENSDDEDPGLTADAFVGDTGTVPNYIGTNPNCVGAFPDTSDDWTLPWSAHPVE
jgi:hypothetical protein